MLTACAGRGQSEGAGCAGRGAVHLTVAAHWTFLAHCGVDRQEVTLGTARWTEENTIQYRSIQMNATVLSAKGTAFVSDESNQCKTHATSRKAVIKSQLCKMRTAACSMKVKCTINFVVVVVLLIFLFCFFVV